MTRVNVLRTPQVVDFLVKLYATAKKLIDGGVKCRMPSVILVGPPGVGKSEAVYQAAERIAGEVFGGREVVIYDDDKFEEIMSNPDRYFVVVDIRLYQHEASEFSGIPRDQGDHVWYKPLRWARVLTRCPGILFLDELNLAREEVRAVSYNLLLDKMAGFTRLNKYVMTVAACNPPSVNPDAQELSPAQLNRAVVIFVEPPEVHEWIEYMKSKYGDRWCKLIAEYLKAHPDKLLDRKSLAKVYETRDFENFPSPRTWTQLALLLADLDKYTKDEIYALCVGLLGHEVGYDVAKFLVKKMSEA